MPTEKLLSYFTAQKAYTGIKPMSFESAYNKALEIFI
jgi:hydroxymethylglutaryl-CoA lyase